jgi:hypothetical protein
MLNQINSSEKNIVFLMLDKRLFFHTRSSGIPFHSTESAVVDHSVGVVMLMVEVDWRTRQFLFSKISGE